MGFLNTDSMPRLVEKLADGDNIKITGNFKGNRVGTVVKKIVEKADDVTKAIEQEVVNDSYSFKVGTGDVDVSSDVEDGFGEIGVKGVTYQNIAYKNTSIPLNCSYSKETGEGIVNYNASHLVSFNFSTDLLKPNTLYTVIINIKENSLVTTSGNSLKLQMADNNITKYVTNGFVGQLKATISTKEISSSFGIVTVTAGATEGRVVFDGYMVLEGNHVDKSNIPSKISNIVGVGDKSKNLFDNTNIEQGTSSYAVGFTWNSVKVNPPAKNRCRMINPINIKPNTSYTIESKDDVKYAVKQFDKDGIGIHDIAWINNTYKFTTLSKANYLVVMFAKKDDSEITVNEVQNYKIQLEEGSTATPYEPYYDGHKIEILSNGKNLLPYDNVNFSPKGITWWDALEGQTFFTGSPTWVSSRAWFYLPQGYYKLTYKQLNNCSLQIVDRNETLQNMNGYFKGGDIALRIRNIDSTLPFGYEGVQIERVEQSNSPSTPYASYVSDKIQILLDEPLMRLPNGTHDEITRDGKLIRRIGKVVFDGTENWTGFKTHFEDFDEFSGNVGNHIILQSNSIVNNFPQTNNHRVVTAGNTTYIRLPKGRVNSLNECKQLLSQNPTIVYYELSTPIITELPAPYLRIFKDGHLTFNTLVAPESNHVVQLNKSAQIERSIREVQGLDSRVGQLESFYDDMMLETNHKLSLLNYDFEYTRERNGE